MIEPIFGNAIGRAIRDVSADLRPASVLNNPLPLHQATLLWDYEDGTKPGDLLVLAQHPQLARGTLLTLRWRAAHGYFASAAIVPGHAREGHATCHALDATFLRRSDLRDGAAKDHQHLCPLPPIP